MEPKRVLIFPAGTEIAFEIHNALKYSKYVELYGANSMHSHAEFVFERYINTDLPFVKDSSFVDKFNELLDEYRIEYVYPAHDDACMILTRYATEIHAKVVTSPYKTVDICRSKNKTYDFFRSESFIPFFYSSVEEIKEYPVFVKPDIGQGAAGTKRIDKQEEIYSVLNTGREYSICEFLPGTEYTVDCFTDRYGVLRVCQPRVRERIKMGIAVRSSLCPLDEEIAGIANIINRKLVFNGAWFFQLKKNLHEEYKLLEISPRIPGTMGASRNLGINFPLLTLFNMWEYDVDIIDNHLDITLDRAFINRYRSNLIYDIVYLDFDDTLYLHDKINICLMAFCYQCVNKHIPIILLTKHSEDIYEALSLFKISSDMFEKIIHINHRQNKADYIKGEHPILIDDSFAERQNVLNQLGIAVYDLDMVESLLDWRM